MRELIVDNFAGGGGASTGIFRALGVHPDIAINHDASALAMHAANHPQTRHICRNIMLVDPLAEIGHRPVGLAWFSPDCKHHSKAKGGKPVKRSIRDLAWVVVLWAKRVRPRVIMLENVEEFRDWGPLVERAPGEFYPCPDRKGQTFERWKGELVRLGYRVEWRELRACDYSAPTIRKRLFLIARRDGEKIVWPAPTHGKPTDPDVIAGRKKPWRTAAEIIDWSQPCHSIFLTREEGRAVGVNRPLAENTMARIAKGVKRYVLDAAKPFIVRVNHGDSRGRRAFDIDEPLPTQTQSRGEALVTPFVAGVGGRMGQSAERPVDKPWQTATTKADSVLVAPYLVPRYGEAPGQEPRARSIEEPSPVVVPTGNGASLVAPHLMVMRNAQKPFKGADEPTQTITADGAHMNLVAAFLAQHNNHRGLEPSSGRDVKEPLSTVVSKGCTQALAAAFLTHNYTSNTAGGNGDLNSPKKTIVAGGTHAAAVSAFLTKYYGPAIGQPADGPLHTATVKPRFGLVTVDIGGEPYAIVDIGMRMLTARELFRAQGFGDDYIIDRGLWDDGWRPMTKTDAIKMCGNSVCPDMAEALAAANYQPRDVEMSSRAPEIGGLFEVAA